MRSSILCLALAGLSTIAQATPVINHDTQNEVRAETRGLITRGLTHMFFPRQVPTASEPPPTRRQATTPPPPLSSAPGGGGGPVNNANRTVTLTVIQGDTLGQIARLLNSGICNIAKLNNIANPDFIEVGQVLQVPINVANPDNDSCLNRGGGIPPANGTPPAPPAPGAAPPGGKKNKKRKRSINFSSPHVHRAHAV
ncbi:intracellular hyphae protein 1 [Colletotrichum truncatum]|uniref:Intracellular hyphae protein 1 n=1 Tax=Colletotrichum truncatum TaxID=5467 RepID=A0ACC3ZBQ4_COLTU|nr:intracellular hyphae protein 1 [Colletotrichum truncatum]KAF6783784.1 intracellular hyphae protein 1 [Colletotrichum truncatum]